MEEALQAAIYTALTNASISNVFDEVPAPATPEASGLYTVIGEVSAEPFHTDDSEGGDFTVTLEHFSRYGGRKEIKQRLEDSRAALDQQELSVNGFAFILCDWLGDEVQPVETEDGKTRRALQRFRVLLDQTG